MRPDLLDLERISFLAQASPETKARLLTTALMQRMPSGVTLVEQGDTAGFLYAVVSGTVAATTRCGERSSIVLMAGPGSAFPVSAIVEDAPMLTSAHTVEESRLLMIPASLLRELIEIDAQLARGLLVYVSAAIRRMVTQLYIQKTSTTPERLAGWILDRLVGNEEPAEVQLPFSKQHLASFLGTSPENLSRAIGTLRAVGTVMHKRKILISDIDGLRRVASGDPVQAASDIASPGIGV